MDDAGPYRSGAQSAACPRCQRSIEDSDGVLGRLVCAAGCGEWYPRAMLDPATWRRTVADAAPPAPPWPWGPAPCAVCSRDMEVRFHAEVRYDVCDAHGLWLDAGEAHHFFARD